MERDLSVGSVRRLRLCKAASGERNRRSVARVNGDVAQVLVLAGFDHDVRLPARAHAVRLLQVVLLPGYQSCRAEAPLLVGLDLRAAGARQARPIYVQEQPR